MNKAQILWVQKGYQIFAWEGPLGLKVERLAKAVGKSKSSFYHFFADLDIFTDFLLKYHLEQSKVVADKEAQCTTLEGLIEVLVEHKIDLLFSRQLRIHRENPAFAECFTKINEISLPAIIPLWSDIIGLADNSYLSGLVLQLSLENFFLQITDETLNPDWLHHYFKNIKDLVRQFKKTGKVPLLDGSV